MTVFVVEWHGMECDGVCGVFSTKELAKAEIDQLRKVDAYGAYDIGEYELDGGRLKNDDLSYMYSTVVSTGSL